MIGHRHFLLDIWLAMIYAPHWRMITHAQGTTKSPRPDDGPGGSRAETASNGGRRKPDYSPPHEGGRKERIHERQRQHQQHRKQHGSAIVKAAMNKHCITDP